MELFYQPKTYRVVCLQWETSTMVLYSGNYISDLWVSTQRNYNDGDVGWTNLPLSVFTPATGLLKRIHQKFLIPSYQGAFISFKRPILPIREVRVVQRTSTRILRGGTTIGGYLGRPTLASSPERVQPNGESRSDTRGDHRNECNDTPSDRTTRHSTGNVSSGRPRTLAK